MNQPVYNSDEDRLLSLALNALADLDTATQQFLADYEGTYLKSKLWKAIRRRILKRDGGLCRRCGGKGSTVHHRSYAPEVLRGEQDEQLITLCEGCHRVVHFRDDDRTRREWSEQEAVLSEAPSTEISISKFDMRRTRNKYPPEWPRMTAVQRATFVSLYNEARTKHLLARQL